MSEDHRDHVRIGSILEIEYWHDAAPAPVRARLEDLGEGGAFVDTANPIAEGAEIDFRLHLPAEKEPITGKAVVRWLQPTVGMGIEFLGLSEPERDRIKFFVASRFFSRSGPS